MPKERRYRDPAFPREQYVKQRQSAESIAEMCDVGSTTISRWLNRHEIERTLKYQDSEWLTEQVHKEGRLVASLAEECNVAASTVSYWIGRHEIRSGSAFRTGTCETCGESFRYYPSVRDGRYCSNACSHEPTKRQVEITCPACATQFTRRASLNTEYCSPGCWGDDLYEGTHQYYRGTWHQQRRRALRRDDYKCTTCGVSQDEHRERTGRGLDVHHIIPLRRFVEHDVPASDAHALRNLRAVCRGCHPDG